MSSMDWLYNNTRGKVLTSSKKGGEPLLKSLLLTELPFYAVDFLPFLNLFHTKAREGASGEKSVPPKGVAPRRGQELKVVYASGRQGDIVPPVRRWGLEKTYPRGRSHDSHSKESRTLQCNLLIGLLRAAKTAYSSRKGGRRPG